MDENMISRPTILITDCSDRSLASILALQFHATGQYRVFATARNEKELDNARAAGIETLTLDVLSKESIEDCVSSLRTLTGDSLDILIINSAASSIASASSEAEIEKGNKSFDMNVWSAVSATHTFLPLLLKSTRGGMIVNRTSVSSPDSPLSSASESIVTTSHSLTQALRSALSPLGVRVVELKSGSSKQVKSVGYYEKITRASMYWPAILIVVYALSGGGRFHDEGVADDAWAKQVVRALSSDIQADTLDLDDKATRSWSDTLSLPTGWLRNVTESAIDFADIKSSMVRYGMKKSIMNSCSV